MSLLDFEIPGYDIIEAIGKGGMASVYRARQHTFDRNVAIKVLKPDLSEDDAFCQRFVMESLIVAKLNHSHIVQVYDVGEIANHYYIAMEFLSGGDLHHRLKEGLPVNEAISITKQIGSALDFAHKKHIIHRDLKPDNVMFREDGAAVLTDFGIAKETNADINLTQTGLIVGTPKYMSPEQIRGSEPTPAGDIYSLGIMFYQLLMNRVPYDGRDLVATAYKHFNDPIPVLPSHLSHFQSLLEGMMAKNAEERIARGKEVVVELERIEKTLPDPIDQHDTLIVESGIDFDNEGETVVKSSYEETRVAPSAKTVVNTSDASAETKVSPSSTPSPKTNQQSDETSQLTALRPSVQPRTMLFGATTISVLVLVIIGGIFVLQNQGEQPEVVTPIQNPNQARIQQLLASAQDDISNARLQKGASNAYDKYNQILALEPENKEAIAGIETLALEYIKLADSEIVKQNFPLAQSHINSAQTLNPNLDVSDIQARYTSAEARYVSPDDKIRSAKTNFKISGLLKEAEILEEQGQYFAPVGNNAAENYRQILQLDPNHTTARKKLSELELKFRQ